MWVIHACLSGPVAPCHLRTWGQVGELFGFLSLIAVAVVAGVSLLVVLLDWRN